MVETALVACGRAPNWPGTGGDCPNWQVALRGRTAAFSRIVRRQVVEGKWSTWTTLACSGRSALFSFAPVVIQRGAGQARVRRIPVKHSAFPQGAAQDVCAVTCPMTTSSGQDHGPATALNRCDAS